MKHAKHAHARPGTWEAPRKPPESPPKGPKPKKIRKTSHRSALAVTAVTLLTMFAIAAGTIYYVSTHTGLRYENNVTIGSVGTPEEQQARLQQMLDRGMITMSINASPVWSLSNKEAGVNWQIENPEGQATKLIRVEVLRDDTGKKIYETGALRPGTYITGTQPDVTLEAGEYPCTAYFYSYDIETEEFLGKAGAQITLYVQP